MTTMTSPLDTLPEPNVSQHIISFKTKKVAYRNATEYARMNNIVGDVVPSEGEVFEALAWNGRHDIHVWLLYSVSVTDEGYTITSHRWYENPLD